jgi:DNA repair protein RadA/Sms
MAPRDANVYRCQECGFASPKPGTCPDCRRASGAWVQLVEERPVTQRTARRAGTPAIQPRPLKDISMEQDDRVRTGIDELDRVLGGGVVRGSLVLIGGDPGVGKSTLLLQAARALARAAPPVLYVTAEESAAQVKMRADRLGIAGDGLLLWPENDLSLVQAQLDDAKPRSLVIDSIQTVFLPELESAPGSVAQVRECGARLMTLAKSRGIATFLVGHVTKEGALAGPRVLEHLVDTVLYFEGERHHSYRVLRAVKNRFGSTNEIGVFEMAEGGLVEVKNPSGFFPRRRPARSSSRASRARGRCCSSCRPSSRPRRSGRPGAPSWGPTTTVCACCWRCSRSARAFRSGARTCSSTWPAAPASPSPPPISVSSSQPPRATWIGRCRATSSSSVRSG